MIWFPPFSETHKYQHHGVRMRNTKCISCHCHASKIMLIFTSDETGACVAAKQMHHVERCVDFVRVDVRMTHTIVEFVFVRSFIVFFSITFFKTTAVMTDSARIQMVELPAFGADSPPHAAAAPLEDLVITELRTPLVEAQGESDQGEERRGWGRLIRGTSAVLATCAAFKELGKSMIAMPAFVREVSDHVRATGRKPSTLEGNGTTIDAAGKCRMTARQRWRKALQCVLQDLHNKEDDDSSTGDGELVPGSCSVSPARGTHGKPVENAGHSIWDILDGTPRSNKIEFPNPHVVRALSFELSDLPVGTRAAVYGTGEAVVSLGSDEDPITPTRESLEAPHGVQHAFEQWKTQEAVIRQTLLAELAEARRQASESRTQTALYRDENESLQLALELERSKGERAHSQLLFAAAAAVDARTVAAAAHNKELELAVKEEQAAGENRLRTWRDELRRCRAEAEAELAAVTCGHREALSRVREELCRERVQLEALKARLKDEAVSEVTMLKAIHRADMADLQAAFAQAKADAASAATRSNQDNLHSAQQNLLVRDAHPPREQSSATHPPISLSAPLLPDPELPTVTDAPPTFPELPTVTDADPTFPDVTDAPPTFPELLTITDAHPTFPDAIGAPPTFPELMAHLKASGNIEDRVTDV
jgi:hypothetical protein